MKNIILVGMFILFVATCGGGFLDLKDNSRNNSSPVIFLIVCVVLGYVLFKFLFN